MSKLKSFYHDKVVLVTGHTGFKGSWLSTWLSLLGAEVHGIALAPSTHPNMHSLLNQEIFASSAFINLSEYQAIENQIATVQPDIVFHLAAQAIVAEAHKSPVTTVATNVTGTATILEAIRCLKKPCTGIMITSDKCYENVEWEWGYRETDRLGGHDVYSASKASAELIIRAFRSSFFAQDSQRTVFSVRAGNVLGGGDWASMRLIPDLYRSWAANESAILRNPYSTRPWQHVLEPLSGYLQLPMEHSKVNNQQNLSASFNFGPPPESNCSVLELVNSIAEVTGLPIPKKPIQIISSNNFKEAGLLQLDCSRAKSELNWRPTLSHLETCGYIAEWYDMYYSLGENSKAAMHELTENQIHAYTQLARKRGMRWAQ